jgi:uncharacterized protein (TIGR03067 family)
MTRWLVLVAFVAAWLSPPLWSPTLLDAAAQEKKEAQEKKDQDLMGTWKLVTMENGGKVSAGPFREDTWIFEGNQIALAGSGVREGKVYFKYTFKLDPAKQPKTIEMTIVEGPREKGRTEFGIYRIDKDTLTLCRGGKEFPKEFSGKGETGLLKFERVKPE